MGIPRTSHRPAAATENTARNWWHVYMSSSSRPNLTRRHLYTSARRIKTYTNVNAFIDNKNKEISQWKGKQRWWERKKKIFQKFCYCYLTKYHCHSLAKALRPAINNSNNNNDNEFWSRFLTLAEYACIVVVCWQPLLCLPPLPSPSHSPNADRKSSQVTGLQREAYYLRWPIPNF